MGILKIKPKRAKIDLKKTFAQNIEYYCTTSVLDRIVCERKEIDYNIELSEEMEKHARIYLVIRKDMQYDIISGTLFEKWLKEQEMEPKEQTPKAKKCMDHYLSKIGY